jgi:ribosomal protein L11 methyltransferase
MYLWQRLAAPHWWRANEKALRSEAGPNLAIIERPGRKRLTIEVAFQLQSRAKEFRRRFSGHVQKLPHDWLKRFARAEKTKPLTIGRRLVIANVEGASAPRTRTDHSVLVIPAGTAFGTGQHVTTAMSLRFLEQLTRAWTEGWTMIDLGTGSGILALAGKRFGAKRVVAIDNDPMAISTAKENGRLNKIHDIGFRRADLRDWKASGQVDVVTANLFSELLIQILPKIANARWLIASGVLRSQETELIRALRRNKFRISTVRRRGKWIALLAGYR